MPGFLTKAAVQGYINQPGGSNLSEWSGAAIPGAPIIFGTGPADAQTFLSQFDAGNGTLLSSQDITALGTDCEFQCAFTLDPDGNVWCYRATGSFPQVTQIVPGTPWKLGLQWGNGSPPTGIPHNPVNSAWLKVGNATYLVFGSFAAAGGDAWDVWVMRSYSGALGFAGHEFNDTGGTTTICAGPQGATTATAYWTVSPFSIFGSEFALGSTVIDAAAALWSVADWPTPNPGITTTTIKTYVATDFDAAWSSITGFSGPAYDATDGNVIVRVTGTGGGNPHYIAKLSTADGSIIWKLAVGNTGFDAQAITRSRIRNGYFVYQNGTSLWAGTVYLIKTADGTFVSEAYTGLGAIDSQVSDDVAGSIIGNAVWDSTQGNIALLNETPSAGTSLGQVFFIQQMPLPPPPGAVSHTRFWMSP